MAKRVCILIAFVICSYNPFAQVLSDTLSLNVVDLPLSQVLDTISAKTGYSFIYNSDLISKSNLYRVTRQQAQIRELLDYLLTGTNLRYDIEKDQIIINRVGPKRSSSRPFVPGTVISGKVTDAETGLPIESINVFLNGTTVGTVTDSLGNYALIADLGVIQVVFSHIQYNTTSFSTRISDQVPLRIDAKLEKALIVLPEVEIETGPLIEDSQKAKYYNTFRKELLGMSNNSMSCSIENPEILDYVKLEDYLSFEVFASEPVIIINRNLGYKLFTLLENFEKSNDITTFHIKVRFEEIPPPKPRFERYWDRNRLKAYLGSKDHFFRSLINGESEAEGFVIYKFDSFEDLASNKVEEIQPGDILQFTDNPEEVVLKFDEFLLVEYLKERPDPGFYTLPSGENLKGGYSRIYGLDDVYKQKSVMFLKTGKLTIERSGLNYNKFAIDVFGYWSWERVGELLPSNYRPMRQ